MDLPASIADKSAYVRLLRTLWSFYEALEARLDSIDGLGQALPDWAARHKLHFLAADLAALGADTPPASPTAAAALAGIDDLASAFGALYVVEGATLGGAVVGPRIHAVLAGADRAFAFYSSYGTQIGPRWRDFIAALSREAGTTAVASDRIVAAACLTFETFLEHVSKEMDGRRA